MFKKLLLVCLITFAIPSFAQYYSGGEDPASVQWSHIKNKRIHLIYPDKAENFAKHIYLFSLNDSLMRAIGFVKVKLPVIVHPFIAISNGMVAWAPKRSELFAIPDQSIYPEIWYQQLAIHEFRHVAQFGILNCGITKIGTIVFGQNVTGAMMGLYLPPWLMEGDAVWHETKYSYSGRGRMPDFLMEPAALLDTKEKLSYENIFFGSYNYFVPDHYKMGYLNVAYGYQKKEKLWSKGIRYVGRNPWMITPLNHFLMENIGLRKAKLTKEATSYFRHTYDSINSDYTKYPEIPITARKKDVVNYEYPFLLSTGDIIALKSGFSYPSQFVRIDAQGNEQKLFFTGRVMERSIDVKGDWLVWTESVHDIRWANRLFSDIFIYNIATKQKTRISKKQYYYAPAFSPDMKSVAVVENTPDGNCRIQVVELSSKQVMKTIDFGKDISLFSPKWVDSSMLSVIVLNKYGKGIQLVSLSDMTKKVVLAPASVDIANMAVKGDTLFYESCQGNRREVHALVLKDQIDRQLTKSRYGAFYPSVSNRELLFSNYTARGYRITRLKLDSAYWNASESNTFIKDLYFAIDTVGLSTLFAKNNDTSIAFHPKKYKRGQHLFYFHSWMPSYENPDNQTDIASGLSILSQNHLSTAITSLGYYRRKDVEYNTYYVDFKYNGWYPMLEMPFEVTKRTYEVAYKSYALCQVVNFKPAIYVPFDFSLGSSTQNLVFGTKLNYSRIQQLSNGDFHINQHYLSSSVQYQNYKRSSLKDLRPRQGYYISLSRSYSLQNDIRGKIYANTEIYLPGFFKNHSFLLGCEYQKFDAGYKTYKFNSSIALPIMYNPVVLDEMLLLSASYRFPLCYPDLKIGSLLYMKRIDMNAFGSYFPSGGYNYKTIGIDLNTESHLLRFVFPVNFGLRVSYSPNLRKFGTEFLSVVLNY